MSEQKNGLQALAHSYGGASRDPGSHNSHNPSGRAPLFGAGQNTNRSQMGVPSGRAPSFGTNQNQQNRPQFGMPPKPQSLMDMPMGTPPGRAPMPLGTPPGRAPMPLGTPPGRAPSFGANHNQNRPQNTVPPKPLMSLPSGGPQTTAPSQRYINCEKNRPFF